MRELIENTLHIVATLGCLAMAWLVEDWLVAALAGLIFLNRLDLITRKR